MADIIEPIQTVIPNAEVSAIVGLEGTALATATDVQMILYTNNASLDNTVVLSSLTEATYGGYARQTISAWNGPYLDQFGQGYILSPLVVFTANGTTSNQIYGSALIKDNGGTQATATNAGNSGAYAVDFDITLAGSGYESPPKVTLSGATGTGATAHAVISGGAVTDIILDNPGSGYTTYTVVIAKPQSLVAANKFAAPVNMALATDALPQIQKIAIGPINNS